MEIQNTVRLYYENAYNRTFIAQLIERGSYQGQPAVRLSHSAFYPTSGGQPHDTGILNGVEVVDVRDGTPLGARPISQTAWDTIAVLHILAHPLPEDTVTVSGRINWPRRYDHMQQHSGQHLLSQTFYRHLGQETISVHFGDLLNTLDLDGPTLSPQQLAAVEVAANEIVWENRPLRAYWRTEAELAKIPLRGRPKVSGQIRIVEIEKFDWAACGGTHVQRTGEIGAIALLRAEKHRGKSRVYFICGRRAVADAAQRRMLLANTARLLDAAVDDVPQLVSKQQQALRNAEKELQVQREALLQWQARDLLAIAEIIEYAPHHALQGRELNRLRLVTQLLSDSEAALLQKLASMLTDEPNVVALLGCVQRGKAMVVFARSPDVSLHMGTLLRDVLKQFGGGGGGRPDFAQGGGMPPEKLTAMLHAASEAVRHTVAYGQ